ncbi:MAG: RHS repeat domain-containing protein, partial [Nitrospirota bacterium]
LRQKYRSGNRIVKMIRTYLKIGFSRKKPSCPRKRASRKARENRIPACAGMTKKDPTTKRRDFEIGSKLCGMGRIFSTLLFLLAFSSYASADEVNYEYDDAGRLIKAINPATNERVLYQYDEVGNLLSITREDHAPQPLPPVIQTIEPDIYLIGQDRGYQVSITGQNLYTIQSISCDNPSVSVQLISSIDTKILVVLSVGENATPGTANITATTAYGSTSIPIGLFQAEISPESAFLFVGGTQSFSVSLNPAASGDYRAIIENENPDIVGTQASVVIPYGEAANFEIKALKEGIGTIEIGNAAATVEVVGGYITAMPVSVSIGWVPGETLISADGVCVAWPPSFNPLISRPVCVEVEQ